MPHIIEGAYLHDILDQPAALAATHAALAPDTALEDVRERLARGAFDRILLTGMGSSLHGLVPLQLRLVGAGYEASLADTSELLHYQLGRVSARTLLVVASQSGRSAEVVRLLEAVRGGGVTTLALTNTAASPLAERAEAVVLTRAGEEATVSCKTYVAAQLALAWLGEWLTGGDADAVHVTLGHAAGMAERYLSRWTEHVAALLPRLDGVRAVFYAGRGPSLAAAATAGLITKESTRRPAEGMSSAALRHGPLEMMDAGVFTLVFAGSDRTRALNEALVVDLRAAHARAWLVGPTAELPVFQLPVVPEIALPVLELLPVEMITLALAAIDDREAGRFERAAKVTATE